MIDMSREKTEKMIELVEKDLLEATVYLNKLIWNGDKFIVYDETVRDMRDDVVSALTTLNTERLKRLDEDDIQL